ncbi:class I SAM-dependent methyltransferase family protein [Candidatus Borrarchaeum sp.]|uniref:class I SAM-dependent methyltransferase n=1 Tax=Candidatus Borrarchaeum sp. TaxID=2846742 RepID=UPI00257FC729|nr:class I SAM-dependent methyltransferase family protein [Candidatus Borrarchaeum sp.]
MSTAYYLCIHKTEGEPVRKLLVRQSLINAKLQIEKDENYIYFPLAKLPSDSEKELIASLVKDFSIGEKVFQVKNQGPKNLLETLEGVLEPNELIFVPHSYDVIGDIAILDIPPELSQHSRTIGEALLRSHKHIKTVLDKKDVIQDLYRVGKYEVIAGENQTETIHREYGCRFAIDVTKAFFSPRLSTEHNRVASLVKPHETVIDMFCGIGPFSILIARKVVSNVHAIDVNPNAIEYLVKNINLNKLRGTVVPYVGDAREVVSKNNLIGIADRVIMNHPVAADEFVDVACTAIKKEGGILHFYDFLKSEELEQSMEENVISQVMGFSRQVEKILTKKIVRPIAPHTYQVVIDLKIN